MKRGRSCVCRFSKVRQPVVQIRSAAQQLLLTAACLICCRTMSLCTSPNPCAECRGRVNYICISWCWLGNPPIHTPKSRAFVDVFTTMNLQITEKLQCLSGRLLLCFRCCDGFRVKNAGKKSNRMHPGVHKTFNLVKKHINSSYTPY